MMMMIQGDVKKVIKIGGPPCLFSCHNTDKYGYLGDFWLSQCATNKLHYFSMQRVISHRV